MKAKFKRIEWLNLFSKGFVVESINNNYKNENIVIDRINKVSSQKRNKNMISTENKNISFEKINLSSNKERTSPKEDNKCLFIDLNELFPKSKNIINNKKEENIIQIEQSNNQKNKEIKKKKNIRKNNSTKNINCINIEKNKVNNKQNKMTKAINTKRKEVKKEISSPLINYINLQKKKLDKIFKQKKENDKKEINNKKKEIKREIEKHENQKIKMNNINLNFNLNLHQYINFNKRIKKRQNNTKNQYEFNFFEETKKLELGDYTFDDETIINESKNTNFNFSDIYDTSFINDKNKINV